MPYYEVDDSTNSILNIISGDSFCTEVSLVSNDEIKYIGKIFGWCFDWRSESNLIDREVYKLTIVGNQKIIQGLISLSVKADHVYINFLESARFNFGKQKLYEGITGNLLAFACQLSFQRGKNGFVAFEAKYCMLEHYTNTYGASEREGHLMVLDTLAAEKLVEKYFKS